MEMESELLDTCSQLNLKKEDMEEED